jgi:hypothetical protein
MKKKEREENESKLGPTRKKIKTKKTKIREAHTRVQKNKSIICFFEIFFSFVSIFSLFYIQET